jgi:hypothetical protein
MYTVYRFHKCLKTFTKLNSTYKDLVYKYNSTCRDLIKKGTYISISFFYGDVIDKTKKFKPDTSNLIKSLKNSKGCHLTTILYSLRQVYFAKNINNLLVQLSITKIIINSLFIVGPTSNYFSTSIFHSIILLFYVQHLIPIIWWYIYSGFWRRLLIFLGGSWLIDIRYARSISYAFLSKE